MRRLFAVTLVLLLLLSLAGCDKFGIDFPFGKFEEPIMDKTPSERETEEDEPPTSLPAVETEAPETQPVIPQVTVSDAYVDTLTVEGYYGPETYCYHIPKFDMDSPQTESLNRAIYLELYEMLEEDVYAYPEQPFLFAMYYEWVQVGNIVSLLVYVQADWGIEIFRIYNAYADGSGIASEAELWSLYGYDESSFYDLVSAKLEEKYLSMYSEYPSKESDPFYMLQLSNTVSYENVRSVEAYISAEGDLCCVATIYSLAGADSYEYLVNLTGSTELELPTCRSEH